MERGCAVDGTAQVRSVFQALGIPGAERAQLVDDPALVRQLARFVAPAPCISRSMYSSRNFPRSSMVTTRGARPAARSMACARIHGLRRTPRPTRTPSTPELECDRRSAPVRCSRRCRTRGSARPDGNVRDEIPVGRSAVALRRRPAVNRDRRRARVLDHLRERSAHSAPRRSIRRAS